MAQKWRSVGLLLRLAIKYFIRWLIREMLEELKQGIVLRVVINGQVYWLLIQLHAHDVRMAGRTVIDVG